MSQKLLEKWLDHTNFIQVISREELSNFLNMSYIEEEDFYSYLKSILGYDVKRFLWYDGLKEYVYSLPTKDILRAALDEPSSGPIISYRQNIFNLTQGWVNGARFKQVIAKDELLQLLGLPFTDRNLVHDVIDDQIRIRKRSYVYSFLPRSEMVAAMNKPSVEEERNRQREILKAHKKELRLKRQKELRIEKEEQRKSEKVHKKNLDRIRSTIHEWVRRYYNQHITSHDELCKELKLTTQEEWQLAHEVMQDILPGWPNTKLPGTPPTLSH